MPTDRLKVISLGGLIFALLLSLRLGSLQIWSVDLYTHQARSQHVKQKVLQANRGRILDHQGRILAMNLESQSFFVNRVSNLDSLRSLAVRFAHEAGQNEGALLRKLVQNRPFVWLARKMFNGPSSDDTPTGVGRIVEMRRNYPMGTLAGQVLGYTDTENQGIEGIERGFDPLLRGKPGELSARVDARGNAISALGAIKRMPYDGEDLYLTIDADYQAIAEEELATAIASFQAHSGIALVMSPYTGEILAIANVPVYDPNAFGDTKSWIRRNRAATDQFEPGSTFKVVAVAAGLEERKIRPTDEFFCENGRLSLSGGEVISDTHPSGMLTVREIVEESSNIGTVKIARKVGKVDLNRYMRLFGFGARTGSDLPGEASGQLRHPAQWSDRSLETLAIGQEVAATALQVAAAYSAIANGGQLMTPTIFKRSERNGVTTLENAPRPIRQVISPETAATLTSILEGVVSHGTGENAQVPGYRVAGKTGTAQQIKEGESGYDPDRYVSSFVGFLPAERPELLCLIAIDKPKDTHFASEVAAPAFSRIMQRILSLRQTPLRHRTYLAEATNLPDDAPDLHLVGLSKQSAVAVLKRLGWAWEFSGQGKQIGDQRLDATRHLAKLTLQNEPPTQPAMLVPDLTGTSLRQAVSHLTSMGLRVQILGSGKVVRQNPQPGARVIPGSLCKVECTRES
ncbi:MAG: penicillin-binding transpeptidase domain-containing protein [bacterium]|nr:penicillin-binding transpeptidase domain-containing protein [bacterium]